MKLAGSTLVQNALQGNLPAVQVQVEIPMDTVVTLCVGAFLTAVAIFLAFQVFRAIS